MDTGIELKTGMVFWKNGNKFVLTTFSSRGEPYLYCKGVARICFKDWRNIVEWLLRPAKEAV